MTRNTGDGSPDALPPGTRVGRWRVVDRLGVGGQGAVYRVEDLDHPGDFHALKLALYVRDARAEREVVLMMTRAAHPLVVRLHGSLCLCELSGRSRFVVLQQSSLFGLASSGLMCSSSILQLYRQSRQRQRSSALPASCP